MSEVFATLYLKPREKLEFGKYGLDFIALECNRAGEVTDFRLEMGHGWENDWAVPVAPNGRLRLIFIGYVTVDDMDPYVIEDPFSIEYSESWEGELGKVGEHILTNVQLHMTHAGYRCESRVRHADGSVRSYLLSYQQA